MASSGPGDGDKILPAEKTNTSASSTSGSATETEYGPVGHSPTRQQTHPDGRWGEEDGNIGEPVNVETAIDDFEELRHELSRRSSHPPAHDPESAGVPANTFVDLEEYLKRTNRERESIDAAPKRIGVSFRDLAVSGFGSGTIPVTTFPTKLLSLFGYEIFTQVKSKFGPAPEPKPIIQGFSGVVKPGEMLLVLGKPGSGSSTLLRALTNQPRAFTIISGEVHYAGLPFELAAGPYRGEILFNDEEDQHIPTLSVEQTLRFALKTKTPSKRVPGTSREEFVDQMVGLLAKMFSMGHVLGTMVGNAFVRGVSGGERKRVSIMEALASRATINAWDNSTRGLDSSTAVDYAKSLRILTTLTSSTTIATLYQVGESIYQEFDKVCVIDSGRQIYYGLASEAREYFESLGFLAAPRITTSDFLTTVTDKNERRIRPGMEGLVPITPEALEDAFRKSKHWTSLQAELAAYDEELKASTDAHDFTRAVREDKSKITRNSTPYTVSFPMQVLYLTQRELQITWQDKTNLYLLLFNTIVLGLVFGSHFYNIQRTSNGTFIMSGVLFFNLLLTGWLQIVEAIKMPMGRAIAAKQNAFGFFRPSALVLARTLADIPLITVQLTIVNLLLYWLANMQHDAGKFFLHWLFVFTIVLAWLAAYRAIGAFSRDINVSIRIGYLFLDVVGLFAGYLQPYSTIKSWVYKWIFWAQPATYAFEALMVNQFDGVDLTCSPESLVPQVPGASVLNQVCTLPGSTPGTNIIKGADYLATFGYSRSHVWRNYGIMWGFILLYLTIAMFGVEYKQWGVGGGSVKMFAGKSKPAEELPVAETPEEKKPLPSPEAKEISDAPTPAALEKEITRELTRPSTRHSLNPTKTATSLMKTSGSIFTWRDVSYTIGTDLKLLHEINGYVKPGRITALMGPSGAGKTTLLDNLALRKRVGITSGELLLNGKNLMPDFERSTAFVEQQDVHDWSATVREAFQFSAMLRQPASVSVPEKMAFVENLIRLLELEPLADALIGMPGYFGLSVEERKRVTIGVELAANPKELLFLDEPTSGLDSNGALSIIRLLRKLADETGIAVLCTIHQPSAILFEDFDDVLLLQKGHQVYFGPIGEAGEDVINYFSRNGAANPEIDANPAEYILEVIRTTPSGTESWGEIWQNSPEARHMFEDISTIIETRRAIPEDRELRTLAYAMPMKDQIREVTKRAWRHYWRDASYGYSKMFSALMVALLGGVVYLDLGNTVREMQNRVFATFIAMWFMPMILTAVQPKFLEFRALYEHRERPSKLYSYQALITAMVIVEAPYALLTSVFFFLPWYYMSGFSHSSDIAGYAFLLIFIYHLWIPLAAIWIAAACKDFIALSIINPIFLSVTMGATGTLVPYNQLNHFWRDWIYWLNPLTHFTKGLAGTLLKNVSVQCAPEEWVRFVPPANQTCGEYFSGWVDGVHGYVRNALETESCEYCGFARGEEFLVGLNVDEGDRWQELGIFAAYLGSNLVLCFVVFWVFREARWGRIWRVWREGRGKRE